jgi:hypothetical protein
MSKGTKETLLTIGYVVAGLAGAMLAGYLAAGGKFLHTPKQLVGYLVVGFSGGLIYSSVRLRGLGMAVVMVVLLYLTQLASSPPIRAASAIGAAIFALPVGISLVVSSCLFQAARRVLFGRFLISCAVLGLGYAVMATFFLVWQHQELVGNFILRQAWLGAKMGACIGLGLELVDLPGRVRPSRSDAGLTM